MDFYIDTNEIGHFEKYHNILKIVVWVVPHVNLTSALSFVHGLSKFAYLVYLRERSGNVGQSILSILLLSFISSGVRQQEK